jgi:putative hydrolase of the HAD superfamily
MKEIQAVLFDLGNTLTRSASLSGSIVGVMDAPITQKLNLGRAQLSRIGIEIDQTINNLYREERLDQPDWRQVWENGAKNVGLDLSSDEVEHLCRAHLTEFVKKCELEPYSISLLKSIQQVNIPLGLVSNVTGPIEIFEKDLREKGLAFFFQVVVWSSGVGYRKPNPKIYEIALESLKLRPGKQIIMVGDSEEADIIGGKNMGFTTVKVDDQGKKAESVADYVVFRSELQGLFERELLWRQAI